MVRHSPLVAIFALSMLLLTTGCVSTDGGIGIEANVSGLADGFDGVGFGGNGSTVSFPIGSDFETGSFEDTTLVVRLSKVEKMDRLAVVDPEGRKLDEIPVEPAQRRVEIGFDGAPAPGEYELVKLDETEGDIQETGSVTFTLRTRPVLVEASVRNGSGRATVRNDGNSPVEITAIAVTNGSGTVIETDLVDRGLAYVAERDGGDAEIRTVITGDRGPLVPPGEERTVQGPGVENASEELSVEVRTRHSGALEP